VSLVLCVLQCSCVAGTVHGRSDARTSDASALDGDAGVDADAGVDGAVDAGGGPVLCDFDGDRVADFAHFDCWTGAWSIMQSNLGEVTVAGGTTALIPVPGDYDGDGRMDVAVFEPVSASWYIEAEGYSYDGPPVQFGWHGTRPVVGDYDGDGTTDLAVYDPVGHDWYIRAPGFDVTAPIHLGVGEAIPVPADYDGDGVTDVAVYVPDSGSWYIDAAGYDVTNPVSFGWNGAIPIPGDYDGDGMADIAVHHHPHSRWYIRAEGFFLGDPSAEPIEFGWHETVPVPADYDGDGKTDIAVYSNLQATWFIRNDEGPMTEINYGQPDVTCPAQYQYETFKRAGTVGCLPAGLGPILTVAEGSDPDVAVDWNFNLHIVYEKPGGVYYKKLHYFTNTELIGETFVGAGNNPQVAVDSANFPHVVMGAVDYARWGNGAFSVATAFAAWRKPRIAIDRDDRVYVGAIEYIAPNAPERAKAVVFQDGAPLTSTILVGNDNIGGMDFDSTDRLHLSWRQQGVYHSVFNFGDAQATWEWVKGNDSDFSWLAVDSRDDSVHIVNTRAQAAGIDYLYKAAGGQFSAVQNFGANLQLADGDFMGPTIDVDQDGYKYVTFTGAPSNPYYLIIDRQGNPVGGVTAVDASTSSGFKFRNPNIASLDRLRGAFVVWGENFVRVRSIGR
jgi:FG-GAP-like repeat